MRYRLLLILLLALNGLSIGCGGKPVQEKKPHVTRLEPRNTPTPYPTRSVPRKGFDASSLEREFNVSFSGPFWVQLVPRDAKTHAVVVGIVPSRSGGDLKNEVNLHRQEFSQTPGSKHLESGTIETEGLGRAMWSWGSFYDGTATMEQLVLFAAHPADGCLVIARTEFPLTGDPIQPELKKLKAIIEIVGPGM